MVGGLADWFAVTALFRHPLGLPIPHTAIIPRNKDRIGDDARLLPARQFPDPHRSSPGGCATSTSPARSAASSPTRRPRGGCAQGGSRLIADLLEALDQERLGGMVKSAVASRLRDARSLAAARPGARGGDHRGPAYADPRRDRHLGRPHARRQRGADPRDGPRARRAGSCARRARREARRRDHRRPAGSSPSTWRSIPPTRFAPRPRKALAALAWDMQLRSRRCSAKVEGWKNEIIANKAVTDWLGGLWENSRAGLLRAARDPDAAMAGRFGEALRAIGRDAPAGRAGSTRRSTSSPAAPPSAWSPATAAASSRWSRRRSAAGTRGPSPAGSRMRSAATFSISGSTAPWSAGWSGWRSTRIDDVPTAGTSGTLDVAVAADGRISRRSTRSMSAPTAWSFSSSRS